MTFRFPLGVPLNWWQRVLLWMFGVCLVAGFGLAWSLSPDSRGFGTHQQLGFPPCTFRFFLGIPCPSCGGTTSFAHFVRGEWIDSIQANVACFVLALSCSLLVPWSWLSSFYGRTIGIESPAWGLIWLMATVCAIALVQWGWWLLSMN